MSSSTTTNPRSTNVPPKNETKKKKEVFKGDVEGMGGAVLQLPNERQRGSPAQFEKFTNALLYYIGREVGEGTARLWAVQYIREGLDNPGTNWSPPIPKRPDDDDEGRALLYESQKEAYKDAIGADWPAAKLEIWSTILGQCSPKMRGHLQQLAFFKTAATTYDCVKLLENANIVSGGGKILGFEPQARADRLLDLVHFKQKGLTVEEYLNEFKAKYAAFKNLGGTLQNKDDKWTAADGTKTTTSQAMLVCLFLANANQKEFGECTRELRNDAASKLVRYPTTLEDAYTMLDEFVKKPKGNNTNDKNNYNNNENVNAYLNIAVDQPEHEICLTSTKYATG